MDHPWMMTNYLHALSLFFLFLFASSAGQSHHAEPLGREPAIHLIPGTEATLQRTAPRSRHSGRIRSLYWRPLSLLRRCLLPVA